MNPRVPPRYKGSYLDEDFDEPHPCHDPYFDGYTRDEDRRSRNSEPRRSPGKGIKGPPPRIAPTSDTKDGKKAPDYGKNNLEEDSASKKAPGAPDSPDDGGWKDIAKQYEKQPASSYHGTTVNKTPREEPLPKGAAPPVSPPVVTQKFDSKILTPAPHQLPPPAVPPTTAFT